MKNEELFIINYDLHPAFKDLIDPQAANAEPLFSEIFSKYDKLYAAIEKAKEQREIADLLREYDSKTEELLAEFLKEADKLDIDEKFRKVTIESFQFAVFEGRKKIFLFLSHSKKPGTDDKITNALNEDGIFKFNFPPELIRRINDSLEIKKIELRKKKKENPKKMDCSISLPFDLKTWKIIEEEILSPNKIYDQLEKYFGKPMIPYYYMVQISTDEDTWYKDCYADKGIPTSDSVYMHFDETFQGVKLIIYLSDVSEENGPFKFLENSHKIDMSISRKLYYKGFDSRFYYNYLNEPEYYNDNFYYRPQFQNEKFRRQLMKLPPILRGSSHFGDDIIDGSEQAKRLKEMEVTVLSSPFNGFIFNGGDVVHRGSQLKKGERFVIQMAFMDPDYASFKDYLDKQKKAELPSVLEDKVTFFQTFKRSIPVPVKKGIKSIVPVSIKKYIKDRFFRVPLEEQIAKVQQVPVSVEMNSPRTSAMNGVLKNQKIKCIDVGTAGGLQPHWYRMFDNIILLGFEPHPESYAKLNGIFEEKIKSGDFIIRNEGVSEVDGEKVLYALNAPTGSSLLEPDTESEYVKDSDYFLPYREIKVKTVSINSALKREKFNSLDAIKLDIQGYEYQVMNSLSSDTLSNLLVAELEINLLDCYKGQKSLSEYLEFFKKNQFTLLDMRTARGSIPVNGDYDFYEQVFGKKKNYEPSIAQRLAEVDAVFIKDFDSVIAQRDALKIRRFTALLCVYNFFHDAALLVRKSGQAGIFSPLELADIYSELRNLQTLMEGELNVHRSNLENVNGIHWGQYMPIPYPSF